MAGKIFERCLSKMVIILYSYLTDSLEMKFLFPLNVEGIASFSSDFQCWSKEVKSYTKQNFSFIFSDWKWLNPMLRCDLLSTIFAGHSVGSLNVKTPILQLLKIVLCCFFDSLPTSIFFCSLLLRCLLDWLEFLDWSLILFSFLSCCLSLSLFVLLSI